MLLILLLLFMLWLIAVPAYAWTQIARVDAAPSGQRPADQPGKTFLLVGSDSRAGLSKAEQRRLGTGSTGGQRTDTIMLVYVPLTGKPALISVPRDSYVDVPRNGKNRINAAYAFGGPELLVQTVEQNTGLRIDGYMEIGFGGFVNVIDALDGIRMCLPNAIKDRDSHIDLPKGCQTLSGTEALGYVRMRKADPRGDFGRVERQREMLAAVAAKAASPATVLNPVRYWNFCMATANAIKLGRDTSLPETLRLAYAMKRISSGNGLTLTVPVSSTGASTQSARPSCGTPPSPKRCSQTLSAETPRASISTPSSKSHHSLFGLARCYSARSCPSPSPAERQHSSRHPGTGAATASVGWPLTIRPRRSHVSTTVSGFNEIDSIP